MLSTPHVAYAALVLGAAFVVTARSYGPRNNRRTWGQGWRWIATRGAAEALLVGVGLGVALVVLDGVLT